MERDDRTVPETLWQNKDYLLLWGGQLVSTLGSQISQVAFPLMVLFLTHSPAQAGLTGALRTLPYLILSLPAGALIDRWDRKRVMIVCDLGRALSLLSIPIAFALGSLTLVHLNVVALIEGTLFVFFNLAEVACLPNVVTKQQLPAAAAQNEITSSLTTVLGPLVSGFLFGIQQVLPFLTDAVSYLVSVCSLFFIKTSFQQQRTTAPSSLWRAILDGLLWLWKQPLLRFLALISGGSNLLSASYMLVIIVLAQRLGASSFMIGIIFMIGGLGWMLGALIAPSLQKRFSFWLLLTVSFWLWAGFVAWYALATSPLMIGLLSFLLFLLWPICNTVLVSYRLALIPDALQGRVNSVFRLIAFSGQPLGFVATGLLFEKIGIPQTVLLTAGGLAVLALLVTLNPSVRQAQSLSAKEAS